MKRIIPTILILMTLIVLSVALSGCSVFGIATKTELEAAISEENEDQRALAERIDTLNGNLSAARRELADLDNRLRPRLAAMDSALAQNDAMVKETKAQWDAMQASMMANLDTIRAEVAVMDQSMGSMREGMVLVTGQAALAHSRSEDAMQAHYDSMLLERNHLQTKLMELEHRLQTWQAEADAQNNQGAPPAGEAPIENVSHQTVTPEKDAS